MTDRTAVEGRAARLVESSLYCRVASREQGRRQLGNRVVGK